MRNFFILTWAVLLLMACGSLVEGQDQEKMQLMTKRTATKEKSCGPKAYKSKVVKLKIFSSAKNVELWRKKYPQRVPKGGEVLTKQLNKLFSEEALGNGNSVTYRLVNNHVQILDNEAMRLGLAGKKDTTLAAQRFCRILNKQKGRENWDVAIIVIDTSERLEAQTSGAAAKQGTICTPNYNCVLLISHQSDYGADTLGLEDRLLAHEMGHLFDIQHACGEGPLTAECRKSIMDSPGSPDSHWIAPSRHAFQTNFDNPRRFRCLEYRCGGRYQKSASFLLETEGNKKVLDNVCFAMYGNDPRNPFKVDVERHGDDAKAVARYRGSYGDVWRQNPQWYKIENVCKGLPCIMKKGNKIKFFGLTADDIDGEPCAVGKKCVKQVCQ